FAESAVHDPNFRHSWWSVSYAYHWLEPPVSGEYQFQSTDAPSEIAILRPIRVVATVRSYQGNSTEVIMAGKPAPMEVLVAPSEGHGDPGPDLQLRYFLHYFRPDDQRQPAQVNVVESRQTPDGRVFVIQPEFIEDPGDGKRGEK